MKTLILTIQRMNTEKLWAAFCGTAGGMTTYILDIQPDFFSKLIQAGFTAFICGMLGAAGKHLYDIVKRKLKNQK